MPIIFTKVFGDILLISVSRDMTCVLVQTNKQTKKPRMHTNPKQRVKLRNSLTFAIKSIIRLPRGDTAVKKQTNKKRISCISTMQAAGSHPCLFWYKNMEGGFVGLCIWSEFQYQWFKVQPSVFTQS